VETYREIRFNRTFMAGETVVVNTNQGRQSAMSYRGDTVENVMNSIDLYSATNMLVPPGETRLHFEAEAGTTYMVVKIFYRQRFHGV
jgi:hypothetical protein